MLEGLFAGKGVKAFIANLRTPAYAPPFGVWIIIDVFYYIISFFISYRVLRHNGDSFLKAVSFKTRVEPRFLVSARCHNRLCVVAGIDCR